MSNQDSLRTQIIDSMYKLDEKYVSDEYPSIETFFDEAIMPVLDAAMKAGELLLHRTTTPITPVPERIVEWLEGCCKVIGTINPQDDTISKLLLLNVLGQLHEGATQALADARAIAPKETTNAAMWGSLDGKSLPLKG